MERTPCHIGILCRDRPQLNLWCRRLPIRACAKLKSTDYGVVTCCGSGSGPVLSQSYMEVGCQVSPPSFGDPNSLPGYSGQLSCNGVSIDVLFSFIESDDGKTLYATLESDALGYSLTQYSDDRLRVSIGGIYNDGETRRQKCCELGIEFDVELHVDGAEGEEPLLDCGAAKIVLDPADLVAVKPCPQCGPRSRPYRCLCQKACITYERQAYGESDYEETVNVCLTNSEYDPHFSASFEDGDRQVQINVFADDPLTFELTLSSGLSGLEPGEAIKVACCHDETSGCNMSATWTWEDEYGDSHTVTIHGDTRAGCTDCLCFLRCLCVRLYDHDTGDFFTSVLCYSEDEYDGFRGWRGDLAAGDNNASEESRGVSIALKCDPCTGETYLELGDSPITGHSHPELTCPELVFSTTVGDESGVGDAGYTVTAESITCDPQECTGGVPPDCCEEVPTQLTAELSPVDGCPCDEIELSLPWTEYSPFALPRVYTQVGTGAASRYFAYDSGPFKICGISHMTFRLLIAPCVDGVVGCEVDEAGWKGILYEVDSKVEDQLYSFCSPCSPVLATITAASLCPPGAADYGSFNLTISE